MPLALVDHGDHTVHLAAADRPCPLAAPSLDHWLGEIEGNPKSDPRIHRIEHRPF
jgi:hypothetical protein